MPQLISSWFTAPGDDAGVAELLAIIATTTISASAVRITPQKRNGLRRRFCSIERILANSEENMSIRRVWPG